MYDYIKYDSPVGRLTIAAEGGKIKAIAAEGQKYEEKHLAGDGRENETPVLRQAKDSLYCLLI